MVHFLSSLFTSPTQRSGVSDDALIEAATERAVEGTDRRLRALRTYRKRLREPVERSVRHVLSLIDALPPPAEISPRAFGADPRLRAFFASADHLRESLGRFRTVRDYLADRARPPPREIFGLLSMIREERTVLGMEIEGERVRRDVMQTAVNFSSHRYLGPADNEADTRWELKKRAFDFLLAKALENLAGERTKRRELDQQRRLLKQKLDALKSGEWGLGLAESDSEESKPDLATLEGEIKRIDGELGQCRTDELGLEASLACIADTLSHPADWLDSREICLRLDYRGIKVTEPSATPAQEIKLMEFFSGTGECRTMFFGRIARTDIPEPTDFLEKAKHYL